MNCPKCGAPLLPDAAFCINCGAPVSPSPAEGTPLEGNTTPELTLTPSGDPLFGDEKPGNASTEEKADTLAAERAETPNIAGGEPSEDVPLEGNTTPELTLAPSGDPLFGEETSGAESSENAVAADCVVADAVAEEAAVANTDEESVATEQPAQDAAAKASVAEDFPQADAASDVTAAPTEDTAIPADEPLDEIEEPAAEDNAEPADEITAENPTPTDEPADAPTEPVPAQPTADEANRFCMGCGAPLLPGVAFCTKCGMPVGTVPEPAVTPFTPPVGGAGGSTPPPAPRKLSAPVIIVIALCAVLFVGVIAGLSIFASRGGSRSSASSAPAVASSEATAPVATPAATPAPTAAPTATPAPTASSVTADTAPHLSSLTIDAGPVAAGGSMRNYNFYFDSSNRLIRVSVTGDNMESLAKYDIRYTADGVAIPDAGCYPHYNTAGVLESVAYGMSGEAASSICVTRFAPDGSVVGFSNCTGGQALTDLNTDWAVTVPYTRGADGRIEYLPTVSACRDGDYNFRVSAKYDDAPAPAAPGSSALDLSSASYCLCPMRYTTNANHGLIIRQGTGTETTRLGVIPFGSDIYVIATSTATPEWVLMTWFNSATGASETGWVNTQYINANYYN